MMIEQTIITSGGRRRRRKVCVDLAEVRRDLATPTAEAHNDWQRMRELLAEQIGESLFAIWLDPIKLLAVDRRGALVIAAPPATTAWTNGRFGRLVATCASQIGREVRFAEEPERHAADGESIAVTRSPSPQEAAR